MINPDIPKVTIKFPEEAYVKPDTTFVGKIRDILWKIWEVVKLVLFVLAGIILFLANPTLFAAGVIAGIVFDDKYREVADKISRIYQENQWKAIGLLGLGAFLSIHVTAVIIAFGYGAYLGYSLLSKQEKEKPEPIKLEGVVVI